MTRKESIYANAGRLLIDNRGRILRWSYRRGRFVMIGQRGAHESNDEAFLRWRPDPDDFNGEKAESDGHNPAETPGHHLYQSTPSLERIDGATHWKSKK